MDFKIIGLESKEIETTRFVSSKRSEMAPCLFYTGFGDEGRVSVSLNRQDKENIFSSLAYRSRYV